MKEKFIMFDLVENKKDQIPYIYLGKVKMKDSIRGWIDGVIYVRRDQPDDTYILEVEEFIDNFKKIEESI